MAKVKALTYPDDDRELPSREVQGDLQTRRVEALDYTQHLVDGVLVIPESVREVLE